MPLCEANRRAKVGRVAEDHLAGERRDVARAVAIHHSNVDVLVPRSTERYEQAAIVRRQRRRVIRAFRRGVLAVEAAASIV